MFPSLSLSFPLGFLLLYKEKKENCKRQGSLHVVFVNMFTEVVYVHMFVRFSAPGASFRSSRSSKLLHFTSPSSLARSGPTTATHSPLVHCLRFGTSSKDARHRFPCPVFVRRCHFLFSCSHVRGCVCELSLSLFAWCSSPGGVVNSASRPSLPPVLPPSLHSPPTPSLHRLSHPSISFRNGRSFSLPFFLWRGGGVCWRFPGCEIQT